MQTVCIRMRQRGTDIVDWLEENNERDILKKISVQYAMQRVDRCRFLFSFQLVQCVAMGYITRASTVTTCWKEKLFVFPFWALRVLVSLMDFFFFSSFVSCLRTQIQMHAFHVERCTNIDSIFIYPLAVFSSTLPFWFSFCLSSNS